MINREKFFAGMRGWGKLTQAQVDGLNEILDGFDADEEMRDVRWQAYALATTKHETAHTYKPIAEFGKGRGKPYGKKDPETGQTYYGRGYVQLTWKRNYQVMTDLLGVDLVNRPDFAMDPEIAYQVLSAGMRDGLFTGKKLSHYINGAKCDYLNARKIINAMDKAALIAGYAKRFETILKESVSDEPIQNGEVTEGATGAESTEIVKTTVVQETASGTKTEETSLVSKITGNEQLKTIASEGVTKLATKATTALTAGSTASATGGSITGKTWLIILSVVMAVGAIAIVIFLLWHKSRKENQAAVINSDKDRADVVFAKK